MILLFSHSIFNLRFHFKLFFTFFYVKGELIGEAVTVFVCATTGQGDPPDNMKVLLTLCYSLTGI